MLCHCVFGYIPIEYPCFDQMFQADCLTGNVMNMHSVATVLCSIGGICNSFSWELHTSRWQMIVWPVAAWSSSEDLRLMALVASGERLSVCPHLLRSVIRRNRCGGSASVGCWFCLLMRFCRFCSCADLKMQTRC